jgi:hypothetical protein
MSSRLAQAFNVAQVVSKKTVCGTRLRPGFGNSENEHPVASPAIWSKRTVFEQLMQNGKKFWIHNFSEPLRGGRFRGSVLRREVWLEIDAVEKALPY